MKLFSLGFSLALLLPGIAAASPVVMAPEAIIADPAHDPAWQDLFGLLSTPKSRVARFEERRTFPYRKTPVVLKGELRLAPNRGLSLTYLGDKPHVIIVDRKGVLMRDQKGRERTGPADGRAEAATSALFNILSFDLAALAKDFEVHGLRDDQSWALGFAPRDRTLADLIGAVIVNGDHGHLNRIEMAKSDQQRIEILLSETKDDVVFSPEELKKFFR
jgi:outer membrane lipoprotein-sorting protein